MPRTIYHVCHNWHVLPHLTLTIRLWVQYYHYLHVKRKMRYRKCSLNIPPWCHWIDTFDGWHYSISSGKHTLSIISEGNLCFIILLQKTGHSLYQLQTSKCRGENQGTICRSFLLVRSQENLSIFMGFHLEFDWDMSSKITHHPVKCEFQINNKEYFSSISYTLCNIWQNLYCANMVSDFYLLVSGQSGLPTSNG